MKTFEKIPEETEKAATQVLDAAFAVHRTLGPGLLECVYQACLRHELRKRNIAHEAEVSLPVIYDGLKLDAGLRLDLLVDCRIIVELKAVEKILPVHEAQLLTYLKLTECRLGFLLNFNVPVLKDGIKRIVL